MRKKKDKPIFHNPHEGIPEAQLPDKFVTTEYGWNTELGTRIDITTVVYTDGVHKQQICETRYLKPEDMNQTLGQNFDLRPKKQIRNTRHFFLYRFEDGINNNGMRTITLSRPISDNSEKILKVKLGKTRADLFDILSQTNSPIQSKDLVEQLGYKSQDVLRKAVEEINDKASKELKLTPQQKLIWITKNEGYYFNPKITIQYVIDENNMWSVDKTLKRILKPYK